MNKQERNILLDYLKGLCIIFVVLGHCIQFGNGSDYLHSIKFFQNPIFKFIYSFHMPLFMLVSGYLFYRTEQKYRFRELVANRVTRIMIPTIIWGIISYIFSMIILKKDFHLIEFFKFPMQSFWFLWTILICSIITVVINKLFTNKIPSYLLLFISFFIVPDIWHAAYVKYMFPYFIAGYYFNIINKRYNLKYLLFVITALFIPQIYLFDNDTYIYTTNFSVVNAPLSQTYNNFLRYAIGFTGSLFIIITSWLFVQSDFSVFRRPVSVISAIGKNSLGIYCFSTILNDVLLRITDPYSFSYLNIFIETVIILICSYILTEMSVKNKYSNAWLLGGR